MISIHKPLRRSSFVSIIEDGTVTLHVGATESRLGPPRLTNCPTHRVPRVPSVDQSERDEGSTYYRERQQGLSAGAHVAASEAATSSIEGFACASASAS